MTVIRWTEGEKNRPPQVRRACTCGCDFRNGYKGVGYVTASDEAGNGVTVWVKTESELEAALLDPAGFLSRHLN